MKQDERLVGGVDHGEDNPALEEDDPQPCGEGMCQCRCDIGHVCGCDCPRCPYCQQDPENCECEED
jgi:hypothetical protein